MQLRKFVIDDDIKNLLPALSAEEFNGLSAKIKQDGHVDHLIVALIRHERILADGHNRLRICEATGVHYEIHEIRFTSKEALIQWVVENQLSRRNLSDEMKTWFMGHKYRAATKESGTQKNGHHKSQVGQNDPPETDRVSKEIADELGVGEKTVRRAAEFVKAVEKIAEKEGDEAKQQILNGNSGMSKKQVIEKAASYDEPPEEEPVKKSKKKQERDEVLDKTGATVPDSLRDAFADPSLASLVGELDAVETMLTAKGWTERAGKLCAHYPFILIEKFKEAAYNALGELQVARSHLASGLPHAICPKCQGINSTGNSKTCRTCRGCGHIPKHRFEELQSEEVAK